MWVRVLSLIQYQWFLFLLFFSIVYYMGRRLLMYKHCEQLVGKNIHASELCTVSFTDNEYSTYIQYSGLVCLYWCFTRMCITKEIYNVNSEISVLIICTGIFCFNTILLPQLLHYTPGHLQYLYHMQVKSIVPFFRYLMEQVSRLLIFSEPWLKNFMNGVIVMLNYEGFISSENLETQH